MSKDIKHLELHHRRMADVIGERDKYRMQLGDLCATILVNLENGHLQITCDAPQIDLEAYIRSKIPAKENDDA